MKKLLLLLVFTTLGFAQTKTTVTGVVQDASGNLATSGTVVFNLSPQNSGIIYFVTGTGIIAPQTGTCGIDGSGNIKNLALSGACQVWGTDLIQPANLTYQVAFFPNGVGSPTNTVAQQCITGTTYDLSNPKFCPVIKPTPQGAVVITSPIQNNLIPSADAVFNLGSASLRYGNVFAANGTFTNNLSAPNIPVGTVNTGAGTTNTIPKYTNGATGVLGNSSVTDNGTTVATSEAVSFGSTLNVTGLATFTDSGTFGGTLGVTGIETDTNVNGIRFANGFSGTGSTQINNAENDCGTSSCVVYIPSTVAAGAGQNLATKDNLFTIDVRSPASNAQQQGTNLLFNIKDTANGAARAKMMLVDPFTPTNVLAPGSSSASFYIHTFPEGNQSGFGTMEAINGTVTIDTGATNSPGAVAGLEAECFVSGTAGNTVSSCRGGTYNMGIVGAGNVTNGVAIQAQAATDTSTGTITNAIGLLAENQTVGTTRNLGIWNQGQTELDGLAAIGTIPVSGVSLFIQPQGSVFGTTQVGIQSVPIASGGATAAGIGVSTRSDIFGGAITQALNVGLRVETPSLNGNTVTEWDGILINPAPTAGTKCSIKVSGATSGASCLNAPATAGVANTLPSTAGTLNVTVGSGTVTTAGTAVTNGTCQAQTAITVTGATTTDVAACSLNAAAPATWQTGIFLSVPEVTANTVTVRLCNGTAASITPAPATVRCTVTR